MNIYEQNPLCICKLDINTGKFVKAYFFLGNIPKSVFNAINRGYKDKDPRYFKWNEKDETIIKNFYGVHWKHKLTPQDPPESDPLATDISVASKRIWGGDDEVDDIVLFDEIKQEEHKKGKKSIIIDNKDISPVYSDVSVFPEDTIIDLRHKLKLISGVSLFRQHFMYYLNEEGPNVPYRITVDGAPLVVSWNSIKTVGDVIIGGITIDKRLEERKDRIKIEMLDSFICLNIISNIRITNCYFIDLYDLFDEDIKNIVKDKYQLDLLYYGCLVKYFPQMSISALKLAITNPEQVGVEYSLLDSEINYDDIMKESNVINQVIKWRSNVKNIKSAITTALIKVLSESIKIKVNIRNVFDYIATSPKISAMCANILVDDDRLFVSKRHSTSYSIKMIDSINKFMQRQPRKDSIVFAIVKNTDYKNVSFIYLTVYLNGKYDVSAEWREDDKMSFKQVIDEISLITIDVIQQINNLKSIVFPIGGLLSTISEFNNTTSIGSVNISTFYPQSISLEKFNNMKNEFRMYEKIGLIRIKGVQQSGNFVFHFRKGITSFDTRVIDKIFVQQYGIVNQYAIFTNIDLLTKWNNVFQGRYIKISHRVTDLKIEINDAENITEFELVQKYIFLFIDNYLESNSKVVQTKTKITEKILKRLHERDPDLYDFKKYDQQADTYSVLCQSGRQPVIYNEEEAKLIKKKLTKYWNFTENTPSYYECPNPKFPHFSLRSGIHPLGYCIPCCKKSLSVSDSSSQKINESCLKKFSDGIKDDVDIVKSDDDLSRHILSNGKFIPLDRIGELPKEINSGLFLDAFNESYNLFCYGVEQTTSTMSDAGFAYSIAFLLASEDENSINVLTELANMVLEFGDTYYALGDGSGAFFQSGKDLCDAIINTFVVKSDELSPFSMGGFANEHWKSILTELVRHVYNVEIICITESLQLELSQEALINIQKKESSVILLYVSSYGTYPIIALNPKFYLRTFLKDKWMAVRKIFEFWNEEQKSKDAMSDNVLICIYDMLNTVVINSSKAPDLLRIVSYIANSESRYRLTERYIDLHNMCYGIKLTSKITSNDVYVPITRSSYPVDEILTIYGIRPETSNISKESLLDFINDYNRWIVETPYNEGSLIKIDKKVIFNNKVIGFKHDGLYFFHSPSDLEDGEILQFDTREIDRYIINKTLHRVEILDEHKKLIEKTKNKNRLYQLFLTEFATVLDIDRNLKMRESLIELIKSTQFTNPKSISQLRHRYYQLLISYPNDLINIRNATTRALIISPKNMSDEIIKTIDATIFDFDKQILKELRDLQYPKDEILKKLQYLLKDRIIISDNEETKPSDDNLFISCKELINKGLCHDGKLKIPSNKIEDFYDLLIYDINNRDKSFILLSSAGIFDKTKFIKRIGEHLFIQIIS